MSKLYFVLSMLIIGALGKCVNETKLISSLLMFRHGDRTPLPSHLNLTTDPEAVAVASGPYGYGQLTDIGRRRCYQLGESILARYGELLSPRFNESEVYIRSTEFTRAKMSVLSAMAAVYPAYPGSWSTDINWVPTPYISVPAKYDYILPSISCPKFITPYKKLMKSNSTRVTQYIDILKVIAEFSGQDSTSTPVIGTFQVHDALISQLSLGVPLDPIVAAIMSELEIAANEAIDVLLGNDEYIALEGGVVVNDFLTQADTLIAAEDTPRLRIYSAHDTSVYSFEAAARVFPRQGVPKYASYFALELRKVDDTGEYVVLAVYQSDPSEDPIYLHISGCDHLLCPYDTFKQLVSTYALDEDTWKIKCDDIRVDDIAVD